MRISLYTLISGSALIAIGMVIGRVLGLLREMLIAARFGTGDTADIAITLLIIPDFINALLIGSAMSAVLVPAFSTYRSEEALALFWQSLAAVVLAFILVAIAIFAGQDYLSHILLQHASTPELSNALLLGLIALPLTAATSIATAWLQSRGKLVVPAFANAIFNSVILLMLWLAPSTLAMMAVAVSLAALCRVIAHFFAVRRCGECNIAHAASSWQLRPSLAIDYAAAIGSGIFSLLPYYIPYAVMALLGGGIALFNYAFKLTLLPAMLLQTIVQLAILPWLVSLRRAEEPSLYKQSVTNMLQLGWIFSLATAITLALAAHPLAELCFSHGQMSGEQSNEIAELFIIGLFGLPGLVLTSLWQQLLYAGGYPRATLMASIMQTMFSLPLCWIGYQQFGTPGVLAAFALSQWLPLPVLVWESRRRHMMMAVRPSNAHAVMTVALLLVFSVLAWIYSQLSLSPVTAIVLAALIGIIALASAMAASLPVRNWLLEQIRH